MINSKYENIWYARKANGVSVVGYDIGYASKITKDTKDAHSVRSASKCLAAYSGSNRYAKVVKVYNVVPHSVSIIPTDTSISLYIASDVKLYIP